MLFNLVLVNLLFTHVCNKWLPSFFPIYYLSPISIYFPISFHFALFTSLTSSSSVGSLLVSVLHGGCPWPYYIWSHCHPSHNFIRSSLQHGFCWKLLSIKYFLQNFHLKIKVKPKILHWSSYQSNGVWLRFLIGYKRKEELQENSWFLDLSVFSPFAVIPSW